MNKLVYLELPILGLSKTVMYEFWYGYLKPKCGEKKTKLCYMDTDSFIFYIKTGDVETRLDTSNYELEIPLLKGKNKKFIGLLKEELGGKIMTEFAILRLKTYGYLTDDDETKKENLNLKIIKTV